MLKAGWLGTSLRMPSRLTCRRKPVSVSPTVDVRVDCLADLTDELTDELLTAAALLRRRLKLLSFPCLAAMFRGDACSLGRHVAWEFLQRTWSTGRQSSCCSTNRLP
jgi:hypothetical protein